ncbi:MAG: FecR domain-containing protein [Planctomycetota bacterium]|nr:MAG: FecR domain-containing protein [Planctomycetota bacterium]
MRYLITLAIVLGFEIGYTLAQVPAGQPSSTPPTTQPAQIDEQFEARIIQVAGKVSYSKTDENGQPGKWQSAKVGDRLPAGTRIRTRLRSKVVMAFGDDSVVMIDRATLASIDEFHRTADTKKVRLGLGHGAIRAGVAETTLRSDMTIDTPTATLSKRGTIDFRMEYTPVTGRFRISLAREGLVQALNKITNQSSLISPGQYITQAMIRWIETATFDRFVPVVDIFGMTDAEELFNMVQESGLGVVEPGGGSGTMALTGRDAGKLFAQLAEERRNRQRRHTRPDFINGRRVYNRPEGNFGTGSGLLPSLLNQKRR